MIIARSISQKKMEPDGILRNQNDELLRLRRLITTILADVQAM